MAKSHFETPLAFKQSLEQRLRDKAATTRTGLNRLRQVLVYERFLARVFEVFGDDAVLKGGIVMELRLERARATKDVDLGIRGNPETILERLWDLNGWLWKPLLGAEALSALKLGRACPASAPKAG